MVSTFEFAPGSPARFVCGGVEGNRILGMAPRPVSWQFWTEIIRDVATASGIPYVWIDATFNAAQRVAQRAEPPSAGGDVSAFPSNTGSKVTSPSLLS